MNQVKKIEGINKKKTIKRQQNKNNEIKIKWKRIKKIKISYKREMNKNKKNERKT